MISSLDTHVRKTHITVIYITQFMLYGQQHRTTTNVPKARRTHFVAHSLNKAGDERLIIVMHAGLQ